MRASCGCSLSAETQREELLVPNPTTERAECENCGDWAKLHPYGVLMLCRPCLDELEARDMENAS